MSARKVILILYQSLIYLAFQIDCLDVIQVPFHQWEGRCGLGMYDPGHSDGICLDPKEE